MGASTEIILDSCGNDMDKPAHGIGRDQEDRIRKDGRTAPTQPLGNRSGWMPERSGNLPPPPPPQENTRVSD